MATMKRNKTKYPGVFYIVNRDGEKVYYIMYRKDGRQVEEKVGKHHADDMTAARASGIRTDRMHGKSLSNNEKRKVKADADSAWTIGKLWEEYHGQLTGTGSNTDRSNWKNHLEKTFSGKKPSDLFKLDTDRIRIAMLKTHSPQTVKHVLALLRRIINFGFKQGYISPLHFVIQMPKVDNCKTEDLTQAELKRLLKELDETKYRVVANVMRIALFTGMRRGEILKLQWSDIDFNRKFILIRNPKGGTDAKVPLNRNAEAVIINIKQTESEFLFPSKKSQTGHLVRIEKPLDSIKKAARLPSEFRPMHGLRHLFATTLASSGKVDMFTLQKLLTHKSPEMTQRYSHLRDDALRKASSTIDDIYGEVMND